MLFREAELEEDSDYFIGPAPPAVVAEVASSNEAERFEEVLSFPSGIINTFKDKHIHQRTNSYSLCKQVTRIMEADVNSPYDVLGVNHNMAADNMKKRYGFCYTFGIQKKIV